MKIFWLKGQCSLKYNNASAFISVSRKFLNKIPIMLTKLLSFTCMKSALATT